MAGKVESVKMWFLKKNFENNVDKEEKLPELQDQSSKPKGKGQ